MTTSLEQLRRTLEEHAADVDRTALHPVARARAVSRRAHGRRRHRRAGLLLAGGLVGLAGVAAVVVVQSNSQDAGPSPAPVAPSTARTSSGPSAAPQDRVVADVRYPGTIEVGGSTYWLGSSYVSDPGSRRGSVQTIVSNTSRVLSWSTTSSTRGVVTVRVDGTVRSRSTAGALESGLVLGPGRVHRIVVTAPSLRRNEQIALAIYDRPGT